MLKSTLAQSIRNKISGLNERGVIVAGTSAGGGMQSAAMLIVKKGAGVWLNNDVVLRLQVDDSQDPFKELRRPVGIAAEQRARRMPPRK